MPIIGTIQMSLCCNEGIEETGEATALISDETADNICPGINTVTGEDIGALYITPLVVTTLDIWNIYSIPTCRFDNPNIVTDDGSSITLNSTLSTCLYCSI